MKKIGLSAFAKADGKKKASVVGISEKEKSEWPAQHSEEGDGKESWPVLRVKCTGAFKLKIDLPLWYSSEILASYKIF